MNLGKARESGFNLMELMVVIVIIGIISGFSINIYGSYHVRAKVTEAMGFLQELRVVADKLYMRYGDINCIDLLCSAGVDVSECSGSASQASRIVDSSHVNTIHAEDKTVAGCDAAWYISVKMKPHGDITVNQDRITFQACADNGSLVWSCIRGDYPVKDDLLPKQCKN